jgi:hypothetical protein
MLHGETQIEGQRLRLAWAKMKTLSQKTKQVGGLAQVVEHLPSKCQIPDQVHPWYHQKKKKRQTKISNVKIIGVVSQVVEHLPSYTSP